MKGDPREPSYLHFDGMAWPNPTDPCEIEHTLRYGEPTRDEMVGAAAFIAAYRQLIDLRVRDRNKRVSAIRRLLGKKATESDPPPLRPEPDKLREMKEGGE